MALLPSNKRLLFIVCLPTWSVSVTTSHILLGFEMFYNTTLNYKIIYLYYFFGQLRYKRWLWWTRFGMVITVLQFVLALYLMCVIIKDFSARKSLKECFSGTFTKTKFVQNTQVYVFFLLCLIYPCFSWWNHPFSRREMLIYKNSSSQSFGLLGAGFLEIPVV
jgi:hypothetical protein